ncbi:MAG: alpha/beta hydrolase [Comamonas sp.]|nr:alpha/beta hydrolase [Candidatus Comamonas equi]
MPSALPWVGKETEDAALAAGQYTGDEVEHWQALAQRVEHPHAGGHTVLHHWAAPEGNGLPPLVLFHGGSGSWTHWVRSIGPLLQAGHDVWAVDLPGFGASDGLPDVTDADGMLPALADLLQAQFAQQAVRLLGFSFGGMTACMLAAAYPHRVAQLVMVGAPGMGVSQEKTFRLKGWRHLPMAEQQLQAHIYNLGALMLQDPALINRDTVALHVQNVWRDRLPRRRISSTDIVLQSLAQVQCPVAAIYGASDVLYPGLLDRVEALMAAQTRHWLGLQRIANAGHWVQYEAPDAFHAALLPLLARQP